MGNRLHLAFKRQVPTEQARAYAEKNCMTFFEVSPLCNFNVIESFTELSRIVLMRHGMEKIWRPNRGEAGPAPAAGPGGGGACGGTGCRLTCPPPVRGALPGPSPTRAERTRGPGRLRSHPG